MKLSYRILSLAFFLMIGKVIFSQSCGLGLETFTGSTNAVPPSGWIKGSGADIGASFPADPTKDPAVGFNLVGEYMISKKYTCLDSISFIYKSSGTASQHSVEVSYSSGDTSIWFPLTTITFTGAAGQNPNQTVYRPITLNVPEQNVLFPFNIRIRWKMVARVSGTFYFDEVCARGTTCTVVPTKLTFSPLSPGCKLENLPFAVKVCATDINGTPAPTYTQNITVAKLSGSGDIIGSLSGNAVNGCYNAIIGFDKEGSYTLSATSTTNSLIGTSSSIPIIEACPATDTIRVMSYNLCNFPLGRDDCGANTVVPQRWDTLTKIVNYIKPDVLMICELQNSVGADSILQYSLNGGASSGKFSAANYVENQSSIVKDYQNMMFYNNQKLTLKSQSEILTNTRDFNQYIVYGNDPGLALTNDTTSMDLYMCHLKAGQSGIDSARRAEDVQVLRDYLLARPTRNNVLGGDLNFYVSNEQAFQLLTTLMATNPFKDPLNQIGPWESNFTYAITHSQSSRGPSSPNYDCGINGGCDSRFDFLLTAEKIMNAADKVSYMPATYKTVGNNGSIYNKQINDPSNSSGVPSLILNSLYYMSDHLPVIADYKLTYPAVTTGCSKVSNVANQGINSLREIIACKVSGDTVSFIPSLHDTTIFIKSPTLVIDKNLTIKADTGKHIKIGSSYPLSASLSSVFTINSGVTVCLDGITIIGGFGPNGSAILNSGNLILKNVTVKDNNAMNIISTIKNMGAGHVTIIGECKLIKSL